MPISTEREWFDAIKQIEVRTSEVDRLGKEMIDKERAFNRATRELQDKQNELLNCSHTKDAIGQGRTILYGNRQVVFTDGKVSFLSFNTVIPVDKSDLSIPV